MMTRKALLFAALICCPPYVSAQTYAPLVTMRVTAPDGSTQDIAARESSVATLTLKDGSKGRPAVDSKSKPNFKVAIVNIEGGPSAKSS